MKLCRFNQGRFGVVTENGVVDVSAVFSGLPTYAYPFPRDDIMVAVLEIEHPASREVAHNCFGGSETLKQPPA